MKRITVTENGPYLVSGAIPIIRMAIEVNEAGESVGWTELERIETPYRYALCRCGNSSTKPFCDGSHAEGGFDGTETAGHVTYADCSVSIDGPGVQLHDARKLCAEARFCDRAGGLWNLVERCGDADALSLAAEEAMLCPSGRYVLRDSVKGESFEPEHEPSIVLVEDPHLGVSGPLFVRGGVEILDALGEPYETRNRVTLCRCGHSSNKPFCDGSHIGAEFDDGALPAR